MKKPNDNDQLTRRTTLHGIAGAGLFPLATSQATAVGSRQAVSATATSGSSLPPLAWEWTDETPDGDQVVQDLIETQDGGVVCAGMEADSSGTQNVLLRKIDTSGTTSWSRTLGGSRNDAALGVLEADDGSLVLCGGSMSEGSELMDTTVWLTDADGTGVRSETLGSTGTNDAAHAITPGHTDGYLLGGGTHYLGGGSGDGEGRLLKIDDNGDEQWSTTLGDGQPGEIYDVTTTTDGEYAFVGTRAGSGDGDERAWLGVVDQNGSLDWSQTYGSAGSRIGYSLVETDDGGFVFTGTTQPPGQDEPRAWVVKVDLRGDLEWERTYGDTGHDALVSIDRAADDGYILAGWTDDDDDDDVGWLLHVDSEGGLEAEQTYGNSGQDRFNTVVGEDHRYTVGGFTTISGQGPTAWTATTGEKPDSVDIRKTRETTTVKSPVTVQVVDPVEDEYEYHWRVANAPSGSSPGLLHGENEAEKSMEEFDQEIGFLENEAETSSEENEETEAKTHAVLRPDVAGEYELEINIRDADGSVVARAETEISVEHHKLTDHGSEYPNKVEGIENASELAEEYAPVYHFHRDEKYFPTRYEAYIENAELRVPTDNSGEVESVTDELTLLNLGNEELLNEGNSDNEYQIDNEDNQLFLKGDENGENNEIVYREHQKKYPPSIHASVTGTEYEGEKYLALTYWAFYLFDAKKEGDSWRGEWDDKVKRLVFKHASDTETVTILFSESGPEWVAAAQHFSGEYMRWEKVAEQSRRDTETFDIYPSLGAHSSFLVESKIDEYKGNIPGQYRWLSEDRVLEDWLSEDVTSTRTIGGAERLVDVTQSYTTWSFNDSNTDVQYDLVMLPGDGSVRTQEKYSENWGKFTGKFRSDEGIDSVENGLLPQQRNNRWEDPGEWFPNRMLREHKVLDDDILPDWVVDEDSNFEIDDEVNRPSKFQIRNFHNRGKKPHTHVAKAEITAVATGETSTEILEVPLGWKESTEIDIPLDDIDFPSESEIEVDVSVLTYPEEIITGPDDVVYTTSQSTEPDFPTITFSQPSVGLRRISQADSVTLLSQDQDGSTERAAHRKETVKYLNDGESVSPGDNVESTITVTNEGDSSETVLVTLIIEDDPGVAIADWPADSQEVSIGPGESTEVELSWEVTEEIPEGTYDLVTEVWLETDTDNLTTQLQSRRDPDAFTVEKPEGELNVTSSPEDVLVTADEEIIGQTPLDIDLPIGTYEIAGIHEEYEPEWEEVTIEAGETTVVSFELEPFEEESSVDDDSDGDGTEADNETNANIGIVDGISSNLDVVAAGALAGLGSIGYLVKRRVDSGEKDKNNQKS